MTMPYPEKLDRPEILQMLFYPRRTGRSAAPAGARDIDVRVDEQAVIGCRLFTADRTDPVILFFHGNGEIVADYDDVGPAFTAEGLHFLVAEYRGYGWSTGQPRATTFLEDAETVYRQARSWLRAEGITGPMFLMGRSLGSACAIDLAARHGEEIAGLVVESGFASTLKLAKTLGLDLEAMGVQEEDTFDNCGKIRRVTRPTLLIHGRLDSLIPLWHAEKLHAESGARLKELQVVPGADHNTVMHTAGPLYFQEIRRFTDKVTGASSWRARRRRFKTAQGSSS